MRARVVIDWPALIRLQHGITAGREVFGEAGERDITFDYVTEHAAAVGVVVANEELRFCAGVLRTARLQEDRARERGVTEQTGAAAGRDNDISDRRGRNFIPEDVAGERIVQRN